MSHRRKAREVALKVLYGLDVINRDAGEAIDLFWANFGAPEDARPFSSLLVEGTWSKKEHLDELISRHSENWSLSRMARVDRNILRLAAYEMMFLPDVPLAATISEAVELAKKYSTAESSKFVNGVLGAMVPERERPEKAEQA